MYCHALVNAVDKSHPSHALVVRDLRQTFYGFAIGVQVLKDIKN